ncbi:MAG: hypothetical protein CMC35_09590 [Flavobacteriaceae bacterium]|nr:hypothetical protein [Flavobacteriaceae bacterium]|tara:strand:- start:140 stop:646 length:507 start_codon:yes stop_codon:yes gene_type:complete
MSLKTKNILLVVGFIILCWVSYTLSISETLTLKKQVGDLNLKKAQFSNIQRSLSALESKEIYLDSILKAYSVNSSSTQNNLLGFLNRKAQELDITIIEFNEPHIVTEENSTVSSYNFILQGSFEEIQSMLYEIEKNRAFGSLKNVTFQKKKNFRKGTDYLECTIVLSQ